MQELINSEYQDNIFYNHILCRMMITIVLNRRDLDETTLGINTV